MLGDTGANVIGAVLGLAVVLGTSEVWRLVVMLTLLALNVGAELVSFGRVIDAIPPLHAFDRLGRHDGSQPGQRVERDVLPEALGEVAVRFQPVAQCGEAAVVLG